MNTRCLEGCRILVVEDDYLIAEDIRYTLEQAGAVVIGPASSVGKALHLLDSKPEIHAAILDVNLGREKSYPVAERLQTDGVPYLFATGYDPADIPAEWRHALIVMKPLQIAFVARLLGRDKPA